MQIFRHIDEIPANFGSSVVTIGNFDGVHCAHRMVIDEVIARAKSRNVRSIAVTLDPHPARVLHPESKLRLITPLTRKLELFAETGLDAVLVLPFDHAMARTSARDFATVVLRDKLQAVEVHEGENFRFGYQAEVGVAGLEEIGRELGFAVRVFHPKIMRGDVVSSSRIRELIKAGNVELTRTLLGRPFSVDSTPASGRGYGTKYTVPTINLAEYGDLLPANGVYATEMQIGEGANAVTFEGVTNAGNRPTFGADSFAVESFLFGFQPIALTEATPLRLTFYKRLRAEMTWPNPEALKAQIVRDVARAERWFALRKALAQR
jgi:riboflavin kinase / FMN adenylyltransferase